MILLKIDLERLGEFLLIVSKVMNMAKIKLKVSVQKWTSFIIHADIEYYFLCTWCYDATLWATCPQYFSFFHAVCCRMHFSIDLHCSIYRSNQRMNITPVDDCPIGMKISMFLFAWWQNSCEKVTQWNERWEIEGGNKLANTLIHCNAIRMESVRMSETRLSHATGYETSEHKCEKLVFTFEPTLD